MFQVLYNYFFCARCFDQRSQNSCSSLSTKFLNLVSLEYEIVFGKFVSQFNFFTATFWLQPGFRIQACQNSVHHWEARRIIKDSRLTIRYRFSKITKDLKHIVDIAVSVFSALWRHDAHCAQGSARTRKEVDVWRWVGRCVCHIMQDHVSEMNNHIGSRFSKVKCKKQVVCNCCRPFAKQICCLQLCFNM